MRRVLILLTVMLGAITFAQTQKKVDGKPAKTAAASQGQMYTPDKINWGPAPDALPKGAEVAVLEGNPMQPGSYTMRLKMPAGYRVPPHSHPSIEHVTVMSGTLRFGSGDTFDEAKMIEFGPGSFAYLDAGAHHYAAAKGETVLQLHGTGPWRIKYVNSGDDPRTKSGMKVK